MKMQKCAEKFFAVCLCVCLMMSFAVSANAAECELRLSDAEGYAGTERTLTLSVKNNPGISNGILFVRYDPEIFSVNENDISVGNIGSKFKIIETDCKQGVVTLGFVSGKNVTEDGVLFTIPVTVALDAYPTQIGFHGFRAAAMHTGRRQRRRIYGYIRRNARFLSCCEKKIIAE